MQQKTPYLYKMFMLLVFNMCVCREKEQKNVRLYAVAKDHFLIKIIKR